MTRCKFLAIILLFAFNPVLAQNTHQLLQKALLKFPYADIHNYKWVELDGKNQLLLPVNIPDTAGRWMLYNASAEKTVFDQHVDFIFDYIISSTQSGILYKDHNNIIYQSWAGLPGQGTAAEPQPIEFMHHNKFVNDYLAITEPGLRQPVYLHVSGRKESPVAVPDSTVLFPLTDLKFQRATIPGTNPGSLLLVDRSMHALYASVEPQPKGVYRIEKDGKFWYLRYFHDKLDSIGPFIYAENFAEGQDYGVVKEMVEGFKVLSLQDFKLYPVPKKSTETVDTLVWLKGTNRFACRYNAPNVLWSLLHLTGGLLDREIDSLSMDGRREIMSVNGNGILLRNTISQAEYIPDIRHAQTIAGKIDDIKFESVKVFTYSYEEETKNPKTGKVTKTNRNVHLLTGNPATDASRQKVYYTTGSTAFSSLEDTVGKLIYQGGRFFIYKHLDRWQVWDAETQKQIPFPEVLWLTEFVQLDERSTLFYTEGLSAGKDGDILYIDNTGKEVKHRNFPQGKILSK